MNDPKKKPRCACGAERDLSVDPPLLLNSHLRFQLVAPRPLDWNGGQRLRACASCGAIYFPLSSKD